MVEALKPANPIGPFDVSDFTPGSAAKRPQAPLSLVREVAEANNYPSRAAPRLRRGRKKTGRTEQLNLRVRAADLARFVEISDEHGWVFGETLEHALAALQRELAGQGA
jgi:hypothetical protein